MNGSRSVAACLLVCTLFFCVAGQVQKHKLCVNLDQGNVINNCRNLNKTESEVNCVFVKDSVDCALKILGGNASFGAFSGEEAVLASKFLLDNGLVTHELRHRDYYLAPFAFQSVAVVKASFPGGLENLRKKNFCHPGFSSTQYWNDYVLKYFERSVVRGSDQICDQSKPAVISEMESLKLFFNSTCRPGAWVDNDYYDQKLKRQFPELCELCDIKGAGCSYMSQRSEGEHASTLRCLTQGQGDVAYVSLQSVVDYFKTAGGGASASNFKFLCKDGTLQNIDSSKPCAWIQQPWTTVVSNKESFGGLQSNLENWLGPNNKNNWQEALRSIMLQNELTVRNVTDTNDSQITITDYIKRGREIPEKNTVSVCANPIRLCVLRNETTKCNWMTAASLTHSISPELQCVIAKDQWDCFKMIQSDKADFMAIDSSLGYIARHTYALTSQMFQDTVSDDYYQAIALISNKRPATSPITNLSHLRGKKGCFAEFGSIGYVSFVEALRKQNILRNACPYGKTLGTFFSQMCAPGAGDATHNQPKAEQNINTCSLCARSCNATMENKYFGDAGAFECLSKAGGDVAFLNGKRVRQIIESKKALVDDYSVLCRNGTVQKLSQEIDRDCALITVVGGELIGRVSRSKTASIDFYLALLSMDDWFGQYRHNSEHVFHMYGEFNGESDLIFKSSTNGLINIFDQQLEEVKDYTDLKSRADQCGAAASASSIVVSVSTLVAAVMLALVARN